MVYIIVGFIVVCIIVWGESASKEADKKEYTRRNIGTERETLSSALSKNNIVPFRKHTVPNTVYGEVFVLDKKNKELAFLRYRNDSYVYKKPIYYWFEKIIEVSLVIDGETVTKTSRGSQLGGALLGSALAGGTGAIIGGLSGKTSSKEEVSKIYLKITMDSSSSSVKTIPFLDEKHPVKKDSKTFQKAFNKATEWEGQLKVIIHNNGKAEGNDKIEIENTSLSTPIALSVADEIKKLHSLVADGIITEEEFAKQKEKLIS